MFETFELSRFGGRPVRLFQFQLQGLTWRFCKAPQDLTIGGFTYLAAQIDRSEIRQTIERAKDKLKITMAYLRDPHAPAYPPTQALGDNWHPYAPSDTMRVICLSTHLGDTDPARVRQFYSQAYEGAPAPTHHNVLDTWYAWHEALS